MKKLSSAFILGLTLLNLSCVKEEGKISQSDIVDDGDTTAGSGSGSITPVVDPLAAQAWHLNNTGQKSFSATAGVSGEDIDLAGVLSSGITGLGIKVAVSDTGTDYAHEDLSANQLIGSHRNYGALDANEWRLGYGAHAHSGESHGTAVTGLIAAVKDNGKGSHGVAPGAKFAAFRFLLDYNGSATAASMLARNIDQTDGDFDVFNYSYGYGQCVFTQEDPLANEAIEDGALNLRNGKGANYVQSAGNDFESTHDYCLGSGGSVPFWGNTNHESDLVSPYKVIVGAVNASGVKSSYSSPGSGIWVSAPGGEYGTTSPAMITTDVSGCAEGYSHSLSPYTFNDGSHTSNRACHYINTMNGTSSAAPVTSAVVALMLQANPLLTSRDVKYILAETADVIDYDPFNNLLNHPGGYDLPLYDYDYKWVQNGSFKYFSNWYGFGRVNALAAVLMATSYSFPLGTHISTLNPVSGSWYYDSGTISDPIVSQDVTGTISSINVLHNLLIESVQVELTIDHTYPADVGINLISPAGTESRLVLINNGVYSMAFPADMQLLTNAFYNESSYGSWTLRIVDGYPGDDGLLENWKIKINGRKVPSDGSAPLAPSGLIHAGTFPSSTVTPTVDFTGSGSGDLLRYEMSVGRTYGGTEVAGWTSIGTSTTGVQLTGLGLLNNTTHYINIRAIDTSETSSSVATSSWFVSY